jgi:hypothetical protein
MQSLAATVVLFRVPPRRGALSRDARPNDREVTDEREQGRTDQVQQDSGHVPRLWWYVPEVDNTRWCGLGNVAEEQFAEVTIQRDQHPHLGDRSREDRLAPAPAIASAAQSTSCPAARRAATLGPGTFSSASKRSAGGTGSVHGSEAHLPTRWRQV